MISTKFERVRFTRLGSSFNDLLRAAQSIEFSVLNSTRYFYNALNVMIKITLISAEGGNFLDKMPSECLRLSSSKSKVVIHKTRQSLQSEFELSFLYNPKEDLKGITTRSGVVYQGPTIPTSSSPKVVERRTEVTKDTVFPTNNGITEDVQPPVVPVENQIPVSKPVVVLVSVPMPNPKPSIPYPSRRNDEKRYPRVPLILGRCFLKTGRAFIDVYEGELTLRVGNEAITYNLDQTSRYSANYNDMTANRIDVVELACEEYSQEVLGFSDEVNESYYDPEGNILLLEALLNSDPSPPSNCNILDFQVLGLKIDGSRVQARSQKDLGSLACIKADKKKLDDIRVVRDFPEDLPAYLLEVQFLGHVVNRDGIHVDPSKVESVKNWMTPESPTEIRSFLGLAGYYRRFIENFSQDRKTLNPVTNRIRHMCGAISKMKLPNLKEKYAMLLC
ncbi:hypothetical protein Tco_0654711 [Tanacetum coccineum]|uniref:Reverse transcriptase domain-containing protein n=1 Tax=Tanacetum coccineum TaxID=301880 RepID=A0ABQ4X401_9ASTR